MVGLATHDSDEMRMIHRDAMADHQMENDEDLMRCPICGDPECGGEACVNGPVHTLITGPCPECGDAVAYGDDTKVKVGQAFYHGPCFDVTVMRNKAEVEADFQDDYGSDDNLPF